MEAAEFVEGLGHATSCQLGKQNRTHTALRFVWHHILPQVCGGKTEPANLVSLCDNDHYSVHILMWYLANGGIPATVTATRKQLALATLGYQQAVAAGTASKIPKEAASG